MSHDKLLHDHCNGSATLQSSDRIERSDVVPMLASEAEIPENDNQNALTITRKYVPVIRVQTPKPCDNKKRIMMIILGSMFVFIALVFLITGTIRFHQCHPSKISAQWDKRFLTVHFDDLVGLNNYALEKNVNQTSMSYLNSNGPAYLAVDGDIKTCSRTDAELSPRLQIDLKYQRPVGFILVHGNLQNALHDITIYVIGEDGLHSYTSETNICEQHKGLVKNQAIITDCGQPLNGRYIIIEMKNSVNALDNLMLCEVIVIQR
ncbi:uncharacterized protein LOC127724941 [Mytilus californianus]|uniref:uncharacterized protein LOC127724941 n=1 Tax=Mytilus californianus TaxID=6549 RepID=UPI002246CC96|nr:uncharacterized protein LOC127724941 [Mytilus californianus]